MHITCTISLARRITFSCFTGSHTGGRIYDKFEEVLDLYEINGKVSFIITDNASNMKAAFPLERDDDQEETEEFWIPNEDTSIDLIRAERISCFAHSLQLVVGDGLKETRAISHAISKAAKVSNLLHRSTSYKVSTPVMAMERRRIYLPECSNLPLSRYPG